MIRTALPLILLLAGAAGASSSTGWRTDGTGLYPEADPPAAWSADGPFAWKTGLPSWSNATPVPAGDRVFVTSEPHSLLCVSARDGSILWTRALGYEDVLPPEEAAKIPAARETRRTVEAAAKPLEKELRNARNRLKQAPDDEALKERVAGLQRRLGEVRAPMKGLEAYSLPGAHTVTGYASPTPAWDGRRVGVVFGNGVAACFDGEGRRLWARILERPPRGWGHSASPVWAGDRLIVHIRRLTALDGATGETRWATDSAPRWGSPVVVDVGGEPVVVTPSGDFVRARDGLKLAANVSSLEYASPLADGDTVYFIEHGGKAVRLPGAAREPFAPEVLWSTTPPKERYYASAVRVGGLLYAVQQKGVLSAIDAADGSVVYSRKLPLRGTVYASLSYAGGLLLASGEQGNTIVFRPGRVFEQVAEHRLEPFRGSLVFTGRRLYLRGRRGLYAIGE